jgi:SAM-dependent methyltransferase
MGARTPLALARRLGAKLAGRGAYHPERYWEGRASDLISMYDHPDTWPERRWLRAGVEEELVPDILRRAGAGSVLVAGAGCGREYAYLQEHGFELRGFDISPSMAAEARSRFPSIPTTVDSVVGADEGQAPADAVVSSAVLTHVPPENIAAAVTSLKRLARRIVVLREKTVLTAPSNYQWQHDYEALFAPWRCTYRQTTDERADERAELMAWVRPELARALCLPNAPSARRRTATTPS